MIEFLREQGLQQQQQDSDGDTVPDKYDAWPGKNDLFEMREAIQDLAGALVGEYYQDKKGFAKNHSLVKEIQDELVRLGYDLGKSGKDKNGVDGDLGAKTILALHNFEQDHAEEVKTAASIQQTIKKGREK